MALRGETIGRAYVKVLADGSGLPQSVRDEMEKAEPIMEAAGHRSSQRYADAFKKEMKKTGEKKITGALNEGVGKSDAIEKYFDSPKWHKQLNRLEREFGDVGVLIGHNIEDGVRSSGDLGGVEARLKNIGAEITRAQVQIKRGTAKDASDFEKTWRAAFLATSRDADRSARDIAESMKVFTSQRDDRDSFFARFRRDLDETAAKAKTQLGKLENVFTRIGKATDLAGNKVGKAFGKGSRNDLINFMSSFVQAPVEIIARLAGGIGELADAGARIKGAFSGAGGGFSGIGAALGEMAPLAGNVLALAGAIAGLVLIMGPVASLISGIAGALFALGASVTFALGAGLGVLVGLMAPLAFGLGTFALAFAGMSQKTKKALSESIKPAVDQFHALQEVARKGVLDALRGDNVKKIGDAFKVLTPLIEDVSRSLGGVIGAFADATSSKGFQEWVTAIGIDIPEMLSTMGDIAIDVFGGIGGVIEGVLPMTQEFLGWLAGVAQQFSDWANSAAGQTQIKDFMDSAGESAKKLWGLISKVGEALGLLIFGPGAKSAGDDLLKSMTDQVQRFIDYLEAHPDAVKNFFRDAEDIARKVGTAVDKVREIFTKLDTPENRQNVQKILDVVTAAMSGISIAAGIASGAAQLFWDTLDLIPVVSTVKQAAKMVGAIGGIGAAFEGAKSQVRVAMSVLVDYFLAGVGTILKGAVKMLGWIPGVGSKLRRASADFEAFRVRATAAIRGVPTAVNVRVAIVGDEQAIKDAAAVAWQVNHIPKAVTTSVLVKVNRMGAPVTAVGGMFTSPQVRMIGEAGPEAVVPLSRPLSQVDPAVRALSAFAQGKLGVVSNSTSRMVNVGGLTIVTPTKDPASVARETVNRLVAASYI